MEHNSDINTKFGIAKFNESTGYFKVQNKYLHNLIWENHYNKSVPKGCVIHHINKLKTDNRIQNLICVPKKIHDSFHSRHRSKETLKKISENHARYWKGKQGENHTSWKSYARVIKNGFNSAGNQRYLIIKNGNSLKSSVNPQALIKWFKNNFPNEYLDVGEGLQ